MTSTPLLDEFHDDAFAAAESVVTALPVTTPLQHLGAVLTVHGLAENGGLMGGAVENMVHTDDVALLEAAAAGWRWLGAADISDLVRRAVEEYRRMRPTGEEDLAESDERLWDDLDETYESLATDARIEAALAGRQAELRAPAN